MKSCLPVLLVLVLVSICPGQRWSMITEPVPETTLTQHQITTHEGEKVLLTFDLPKSNAITRSPGPRHYGPHPGCLMCLHNHLVGTHGQSSEYLNKSGWGSWQTIHDNLHNDPNFRGETGPGYYTSSRIAAPKGPTASAFAPTPLDVCEKMLEMANITEDDVLYDLGCGDGRLLIMAVLKYNCRAVGLDIDPKCVEMTQKNVEKYGLQDSIRVYQRDVTTTAIPTATVVTLYLMPNLTARMRLPLQNLSPGTRIVAHDKPIPDWEPLQVSKVESKVDAHEHSIYLWNTAN